MSRIPPHHPCTLIRRVYYGYAPIGSQERGLGISGDTEYVPYVKIQATVDEA